MRLVYLDEAGVSSPAQEPILVVAGVIVEAMLGDEENLNDDGTSPTTKETNERAQCARQTS